MRVLLAYASYESVHARFSAIGRRQFRTHSARPGAERDNGRSGHVRSSRLSPSGPRAGGFGRRRKHSGIGPGSAPPTHDLVSPVTSVTSVITLIAPAFPPFTPMAWSPTVTSLSMLPPFIAGNAYRPLPVR